MEGMKSKFYELLTESMTKKNSPFLITEEKYKMIMEELKTAHEKKTKKSGHEYRLISRFTIYNIDGNEVLGLRKEKESDLIVYVITVEEIYDKILETHYVTGHGGRNRMASALCGKYCGITFETIKIFLSLCKDCKLKKKQFKKGLAGKPTIPSEMNSRGQVDVIDMRTQPDGEFRFILNYQDHVTKFVQLRAMRTRTALEVAGKLRKIFLTFGAPHILQSGDGREFTNKIIKNLLKLWPACKMVHGNPRQVQSQGTFESANEDVRHMLVCYMQTNDTTAWARALWDVQFSKNGALHHGIKRSPYAAMFGVKPKIGLATSNLPEEVIDGLKSEEDLEKALRHESGMCEDEGSGGQRENYGQSDEVSDTEFS